MAANKLQQNLHRLSKVHMLYLICFGASLLAYHAWKLLTPDALRGHWIAFSIILLILAYVWLQASVTGKKPLYYQRLAWLLIGSDLALAAFVVYAQRGVASRGVALFAIPIVVATVFANKTALFTTAILSVLTYVLTSLIYAATYPSEGYKIELYGTVAFYSATFLLLAALLWIFVRPDPK